MNGTIFCVRWWVGHISLKILILSPCQEGFGVQLKVTSMASNMLGKKIKKKKLKVWGQGNRFHPEGRLHVLSLEFWIHYLSDVQATWRLLLCSMGMGGSSSLHYSKILYSKLVIQWFACITNHNQWGCNVNAVRGLHCILESMQSLVENSRYIGYGCWQNNVKWVSSITKTLRKGCHSFKWD